MSFPVLFGDLEKMLRLADSGVVDNHIELAECGRGLMNGSLRMFAVANINGSHESFPAEGLDLFGDREVLQELVHLSGVHDVIVD